MSTQTVFDAVVVGGGPAGATAATDLARAGRSVLLLDRAGRIKPCGGAIPPRLIADFDIPASLLVARIRSARMVSPRDRHVHMPIDGGFVGMVDRDAFDEWLRQRAAGAGAQRRTGTFERIEPGPSQALVAVRYREPAAEGGAERRVDRGADRNADRGADRGADGGARVGAERIVLARAVIGADGARSEVARQALPDVPMPPCVFAYHEIVRSPRDGAGGFDGSRCDVWYQGRLSPDFYGWVFPHGDTTSIGSGTMRRGFSLRDSVAQLRSAAGLANCETVRREGAPLPLHPLPRWDDGRHVVLAGDAAGVVAPASGEGIYYAMLGGRLAAQAVDAFLATGKARRLADARARFMREHGKVFRALGWMQRFWYASDDRRERFVHLCRDRDIQQLTWDAYMNKALVRARPVAHLRILCKNIAHLTGMAST